MHDPLINRAWSDNPKHGSFHFEKESPTEQTQEEEEKNLFYEKRSALNMKTSVEQRSVLKKMF